MRTVIAAALLAASFSMSHAAEPIATPEQRLAVQVASLTLQLAHAGEVIDKQRQQIEELQKVKGVATPEASKSDIPK